MAQKDDQIATMQQKLQSLSTNLSASNQELTSKEHSIQTLTAEVEKLKVNSSKTSSLRILELTRDQAESVEQMRSTIVTLAQNLEKSENRRAEVIDKIETERQGHAEKLRQITLNMKRFYSSLKMSST